MSAPRPSVVRTLVLALALSPPAFADGATLSDAESVRAANLARSVPWEGSRESARGSTRVPVRVDPVPDTHPLGVQMLVVEREPGKHAPATSRLARVYQYDHDARRTRRVRLDLVSGETFGTHPIDSHHLPLNGTERRWALARLAADGPLLARLRDEQRARGLTPFATLAELDVKASVFEPLDPAHPCHAERCALLSLFDATRTVFAVEPLVRFASGQVLTLADAGGR